MNFSDEDKEMAAMILAMCASSNWPGLGEAAQAIGASDAAFELAQKAFIHNDSGSTLREYYAGGEAMIRTGWLPS